MDQSFRIYSQEIEFLVHQKLVEFSEIQVLQRVAYILLMQIHPKDLQFGGKKKKLVGRKIKLEVLTALDLIPKTLKKNPPGVTNSIGFMTLCKI
jgi:hypothetical protein